MDAATAALAGMALGQRLWCQASGDTYGRRAAFCSRSDGTDLSCAMVACAYVARWEQYCRAISARRTCPQSSYRHRELEGAIGALHHAFYCGAMIELKAPSTVFPLRALLP